MMTRRISLLLLVAALVPSLVPQPLAASSGAFYERMVDPPRETKIPVGIDHRKGSILWVESQNDPRPDDVADAEKTDPNDKTWMLLRFFYKNEDFVGYRVNLRVVVLDESGGVLAEGGRKATLDPRKVEDTISFPLRVKTLDWPRARNVKVLATFLD